MENSKIQWTDHTWNVAVGCNKVSEGCKYCYMMRDMGGVHKMDVDGTITRTKRNIFQKPLKWQGQAKAQGVKFKVFTSSLTDFFHEKIDGYRTEAFRIIAQCPDLIFQILTKRPERIKHTLMDALAEAITRNDGTAADSKLIWMLEKWVVYDEPPKNVWLGTTAENQKRANERIPLLLEIPAVCHFLSIEPILGPVDLWRIASPKHGIDNCLSPGSVYSGESKSKIDWVIIGGESGNENGDWKYRPAKLEWFNSIIEQCHRNGTTVFVKQLGTHLAKSINPATNEKYSADRHGLDIENAFPAFKYNVFGLRIEEILRQFPVL